MPFRPLAPGPGGLAAFVLRLAVSVCSLSLLANATARAGEAIPVAIRFHAGSDLEMVKDGVTMRSWVTERQIRDVVLPEVNRIWRPAGIVFVLDAVERVRTLRPANRQHLLEEIAASTRDEDGESDPERIRKLGELLAFGDEAPPPLRVYFVPYLGEASQGNTKRKRGRVVVGEWTDKPSKGRGPPERCALSESGDFVRGSLGRTIAHELGHALGLSHPDKTTQTEFGRLMGGRKPGYRLTPPEISVARSAAEALARR